MRQHMRLPRCIRTLARSVGFAVVVATPFASAAAQRGIPTPASILGFEPGADRHLPSWKQIIDYFTALDEASPRVSVRTLGKTTLGRPFIVAFISDSSTLANLEHYRQIQRKLMDPRLQAAGERQRLIDEGKNVILVTSAIHSTESGGFTTPIVLADRLARAQDREAKEILANTIIMLVPSQNPDGVDIVGDYYRSTLGTPAEGRDPPDLYHKYVGHDDNRDWYSFTQVETRYTVDSLYTPWDPQIVNDIHQQGANAGRIFIPPYMDPVEPNIDPILTAATNGLGMSIVWRMTNEGFTGIASNASYDQWSPARQYSLYHRGARLLTETASARLATPIDIPFDQLGTGRGYDARVVSWNFPSLWPGGHWTYGDIVRYQTAASWALFLDAAQNRRAWLEGYAAQGDRALGTLPAWGTDKWPSAIVIPKTQPDTQALKRMIWTLQHGQVEVRETTAPVTVDGKTYAAGSYVDSHQAAVRRLREGAARAADSIPICSTIRAARRSARTTSPRTRFRCCSASTSRTCTGAAPAAGRAIKEIPEPTYTSALSGKSTKRIALFRRARRNRWTTGGRTGSSTHTRFRTRSSRRRTSRPARSTTGSTRSSSPRAASAAAAGRGGRGGGAGGGAQRRSVRGARRVRERRRERARVQHARRRAMIDGLKLPVKNVLAGVRNTDFYAPGSILGVEIKRDHPIARGFTATMPAIWFENGPAFEISDPARATAVASYPATGNPLLSGWLLGGAKLNGKAALVDVKRGKGHVVLYGFRPQYRGQAMATYPLIWGGILE